MQNKLKIAIIGVGRWGKILLREFEKQCEVTAVFHRGADETAQYLANAHPHINPVSSLEEIWNNKDITAVCVATPTQTHFDITSAALRAGKHVFLEKPGGGNADKLSELSVLANAKGLRLALGYEFVHHPILQALLSELGDVAIREIKFVWKKWGSFNDHPVPHLFCHDASVLLALGVVPDRVCAYSSTGVQSEADIVSTCLASGNIQIQSDINRVSDMKEKTVSITTEHEVFLWTNDSLSKKNHDKEYEPIVIHDNTNSVAREIEDFLSCVSSGGVLKTDAAFGIRVLDVIDLVQNFSRQQV
jgi:predicted dehydrogenase